MIPVADPLLTREWPDRLHYATGELLGADDFRDEQTYHRRQLARALLYLHGTGTIAGLRVVANHQPAAPGGEDEVELEVRPGLALDRAGRLLEIPREACLRLRRWFQFIANRPPASPEINVSHLRAAHHNGAVVADVFLTFHPCDRGYTPAFATGPFDALDASQPSRIRDGYELTLALRTDATDPDTVPALQAAFDPWSQISGATQDDRLAAAQNLSLDAWDALALPPPDHVGAWHENPPGIDPTAVLLARLRIPASVPPADATLPPTPDWGAATWPATNPNVRNSVRNFLLPPAALRRIAAT